MKNKTLGPFWLSGIKIENKIVKEDCIPVYKDKEQIDCIKTGKVNVSNKIYSFYNYYCKLERKDLSCIHYKEGGKWNTCKLDGSVTCYKINLEMDKEIFYNSLITKLK